MRKLDQNVKEVAAFETRRREEILSKLAETPEFRFFVWTLCQRCGLTDAYAEDSGSAMFRVEGRRAVAVEVLREIDGVLRQKGPHAFYGRVIAEAQAFQREMDSYKPPAEGEESEDA